MSSKREMPWRPAYEFYAAIGWLVSLVFIFMGALAASLPTGPFWYMAVIAITFMVLNTKSALRIWSIKLA
ncbi:MAG: hypothetical protein WCH01_07445, partial [Methylococcaceae bacterium]